MTHERTKEKQGDKQKKVYGVDLNFALIYEKIKMRVPVTPKERDYYLKEKKYYGIR